MRKLCNGLLMVDNFDELEDYIQYIQKLAQLGLQYKNFIAYMCECKNANNCITENMLV